MKMIWMMTFSVLPLVAIGYIAWHVWCLLPCSWPWRLLLILLLAASFLLMFAGIWRSTENMPLSVATAAYEVGTSSVFILLYLVLIFLALDLGRLVRLVPRAWLYDNWWTAGGIAVFMTVLFVYGNLHYRHKHREELTITTDKVTRPMKLVMLSDLHLGYHNPRKELSRWIDIINGEQPDVVLIAGDIIDMSIRPLREERMYEEFQRLKAPVYACLGNHEYYSGQPGALQFYHDAGIHLLRDSCADYGDLCIIGRDDRANQHRQSLGKIMKSASISHHPSSISHHPSPFTILLDHQPYHLEPLSI